MRTTTSLTVMLALLLAVPAAAQGAHPDEAAFRATYKELVETNTAHSTGIRSYGVPGILYEPDGGGIHGLNEHIRVKSVLDGRDYLYRLIRLYADAA